MESLNKSQYKSIFFQQVCCYEDNMLKSSKYQDNPFQNKDENTIHRDLNQMDHSIGFCSSKTVVIQQK